MKDFQVKCEGASEIRNVNWDPGVGMWNVATLRPLWGWDNVRMYLWALRTLWGCSCNGIWDPGFGMWNVATLRPLWGCSKVWTCPRALRTLWGCGWTDWLGLVGKWMGRSLRTLRGSEGDPGDSTHEQA